MGPDGQIGGIVGAQKPTDYNLNVVAANRVAINVIPSNWTGGWVIIVTAVIEGSKFVLFFGPFGVSANFGDILKEIGAILECCQPIVCQNGTADGPCNLLDQPTNWTTHFWELFSGPMSTGKHSNSHVFRVSNYTLYLTIAVSNLNMAAAYWADYFELQYVNNNSDVMFGRLGSAVPLPRRLTMQDKLAQYAALSRTAFETATSYWAAQNFGSVFVGR